MRSERPFKEWPLLILEEKIYNLLIRKPFVLLDIAIISLFDAQWNSLQYGVQHTRTLGAVDDDVGRRR